MKLKDRYFSEIPGYGKRFSNYAPRAKTLDLMTLKGYHHMKDNYPFGCALCVHPLK